MSFTPLDSQTPRRLSGHDGRPVAIAAPAGGEVGKLLRMFGVLFLMLVVSAIFAITAMGQQPKYEELQLPEAFDDESLVRRMEIAARNFAGRGSAETNVAKYYFQNYVPAKMTQRAALPEMSEMVNNASSLLTRAQRAGNPRANQILQWLYAGMKKVAEGNYFPPAKINAVLVLGRLDERAMDQVNQTPPVPLRYSLPILIAQYNDKTNVDGVRAAALQGLHRHVAFSLPRFSDEEKTSVKTAMESLLSSTAPPERSDDAHAYLQRYAVDVLDLMRAQDDPALGEQLVSISTETKRPNLIVLHSMARLGRMSKEMQGKITEPADLLTNWSARALRAFEAERDRINALERPKNAPKQPPLPEDFLDQSAKKTTSPNRRAGMDDMMGDMMEMEEGGYDMMEMEEEMGGSDMMMEMMGGMSGMMGVVPTNPQPPEVIASRRYLNHVLQMIHLGVTGSPTAGMPRQPGGVLAMVSAEKKPEVEAWVTEMQPIVEAINDLKLDQRETYMEALETQIELLAGMVGEDVDRAAAAEVDDLLNNPNLLNNPAPANGGAPANGPDPAAPVDPADALLEEMTAP